MRETTINYKMIDISNFHELDRNILLQMHEILKTSANWNDSFSDFKKNYTKRNFKNTKIFFILHNGEVAGFLEGWVFNKTEFLSKSFYISPKYKGQALGTKLRARTFSKLKSLGFKKFKEGMIVNDLVKKITENLVIKRKKESLRKQPKLNFPYALKKKNGVLFKKFKRRPGKK